MSKSFWWFAILGGLAWNIGLDLLAFLAWRGWGGLWRPMTVIIFLVWCALMGGTAAAWPSKPEPPPETTQPRPHDPAAREPGSTR